MQPTTRYRGCVKTQIQKDGSSPANLQVDRFLGITEFSHSRYRVVVRTSWTRYVLRASTQTASAIN